MKNIEDISDPFIRVALVGSLLALCAATTYRIMRPEVSELPDAFICKIGSNTRIRGATFNGPTMLVVRGTDVVIDHCAWKDNVAGYTVEMPAYTMIKSPTKGVFIGTIRAGSLLGFKRYTNYFTNSAVVVHGTANTADGITQHDLDRVVEEATESKSKRGPRLINTNDNSIAHGSERQRLMR